MVDKDEALRLALEALEEPKQHVAKQRRLEAIIAIKEVLAQPEQEITLDQAIIGVTPHGTYKDWEKTQRTWVGLMDEEYMDILKQNENNGFLCFYNLVEAKLREKNGG